MHAELAGQWSDVGDKGDLTAHVQAPGGDLHAERSAADDDNRRARCGQFLEEDGILNGSQRELPGRELSAGASPLRRRSPVKRGEPLRPRTGGNDQAVIRQLTTAIQSNHPGVDVQASGTDAEQFGGVVGWLRQFVGLQVVVAVKQCF
jgi:hypothetical protein